MNTFRENARTTQAAVWMLILLGVILLYLVWLYLVWRDPINRLEIRMNFPMNLSGMGGIVRLPGTASAEDVIRSSSQFHHFRILETRRIMLLNKTAVWVESDRGEKLVLITYNPVEGWFVQVRDP